MPNRRRSNPKRRRILWAALIAVVVPAVVFAWLASSASRQERPGFFLPDAKVEIAPGAKPFPKHLRAIGDLTYEFKGKTRTLNQYLARRETRAFVVVRDGAVVFERYGHGFSPGSRQQSWSMAKSVLSALYGIALERGYVDSIGDPLAKYVPELKGNGFSGVTIRQALAMSSGVRWHEHGPERRELFVNAIRNHLTFGAAGKTIHQSTASPALTRAATPGRAYNYASINTQALGWALERATKRRFHELLRDWIWKPAGMASTATVTTDGSGNDFVFCCIHATARDYARFGWLFALGGRVGARQIVPGGWIRQSTTVENFKTNDGYGYGLHWRVPHDGAGDFAAAGYAGQMIYVSPRDRTVVVRLARDKETLPFETFSLGRAVAEGLAGRADVRGRGAGRGGKARASEDSNL